MPTESTMSALQILQEMDSQQKEGKEIIIDWPKILPEIEKDYEKYLPILRSIIYHGYDFSDNPDVLTRKDMRHIVDKCLSRPEHFVDDEARRKVRKAVREEDRYQRERQIRSITQQKEAQRLDINFYLSQASSLTATAIDRFVRAGGDIQKVDWSLLKKITFSDSERYKKLVRAIIYNGYDFNQATEVLCHTRVLPLAEECLQHPSGFKDKDAITSLQSLVPIAREYVDIQAIDYQAFNEARKKKMMEVAIRFNEKLEEERRQTVYNINFFTNAEKIDTLVKQGTDIQTINWDEVRKLRDAKFNKIVRAIMYNGYDFSERPDILRIGQVRALARECLEHPDAFKVKGAHRRLAQELGKQMTNSFNPFISNRSTSR